MENEITELAGYTTKDGQTWTVKADAERHAAFLHANDNFKDALTKLNIRLIETFKTADGFPFDFSVWNYYYVTDHYWNEPSVCRVSIYPSGVSTDISGVAPLIRVNRWSEGKYISEEYTLSRLYLNEENAKAKVLELYKSHIAKLQKRSDALEQSIKK